MQGRVMTRVSILMGAILGAFALSTARSGVHAGSPDASSWDPRAAAAYLDGRAEWWMSWPDAARDRGTFCVSCHTAVPYALARPALRTIMGERERTVAEAKLVANVATRVNSWNEVAPFYPDQSRGLPKTSESRGTEAILNALILSIRDGESGRLGDDTRTAFRNMWALQMRTGDLSGAWAWLDFHYEPWESHGAPYFGAALAAVAVGSAPAGYTSDADIKDNLKLLRDFFQREYEHQPPFNRVMLLWASARVPQLVTAEQRKAIIDAAFHEQHADGGWSLASLGSWKRLDGTSIDERSDGYATGLVALALQRAGISARDERVVRALDWLNRNQVRATGQWIASSLNKERDPATDIGKFMSDAATGFAVLSLAAAR
jgi:squalene-hopene/tetraprenyl-beta-curcumene cyclase